MGAPTLLLLRHGETEANRDGRVQGRQDSPLTALGLAQARAMGRAVAARIGDGAGWRLVSSPLGRCVVTARLVAAESGLAFGDGSTDPRLAEIDTGSFSGLTKAELDARRPGLTRGAGLDHWAFQSPDGESHAHLSARLADWLGGLAPDARLVVVSHGIAGRVLRGLSLGLDPDRALRLPSPQDALFHLSDGRIDTVPC